MCWPTRTQSTSASISAASSAVRSGRAEKSLSGRPERPGSVQNTNLQYRTSEVKFDHVKDRTLYQCNWFTRTGQHKYFDSWPSWSGSSPGHLVDREARTLCSRGDSCLQDARHGLGRAWHFHHDSEH